MRTAFALAALVPMAVCLSGCQSDPGAIKQATPSVTPLAVVAPQAPPTVLAGPPAKKYNELRGPNYTSKVILTFDDCPTSFANFRATVNAAHDLGIALVLAPVGGGCLRTPSNPAGAFDAAYARSKGHYVIDHTVNHPDLTRLSQKRIRQELSYGTTSAGKRLGIGSNFGRPPFGAINSEVRKAYRSVSMNPWLWDVDTNDWRGPKSFAAIVKVIANEAKAGSTVLMHMQHAAFTPANIRAIKATLNKKGLQPCKSYPGGATPTILPSSLPC